MDPALDLAAMAPPPKERKKPRKGRKAKPRPLTAFEAYCASDDLDVEKLTLVDGQTPTVFTIRGLTSREKDIAVSLTIRRQVREEDGETTDPDDALLASAAYLGMCVRLGLQAVEGWEGWDYKRIKRYGVTMLPDEALDALDAQTLGFLGIAIHKLSTVPLEPEPPSGS